MQQTTSQEAEIRKIISDSINSYSVMGKDEDIRLNVGANGHLPLQGIFVLTI